MWTASDTVRVGDVHVGIRSNPSSLSHRVRTVLAAHLVDGVEAPPNYSLRLETREPGRPGPASAYVLYRAQCRLLRTRRAEKVLRALVCCLAGHVGQHENLVRIRQLAVVGRRGAIMLPPELYLRVEAIEPRLLANGLSLADPPFAHVDVRTGELVLVPHGMNVDEASFGAPAPPTTRAPAVTTHERYRIRAWAVLNREGGALTPHEALVGLLPSLDKDAVVADAMGGLLRALEGAALSPIWYERPGRLFERIVSGEI